MPRLRFTNPAIAKLKPQPREVTYWDLALPGFGLRVSPTTGRKTWIWMAKIKDGKEVMASINTFALLPDVEQARELARTAINLAHEGIDPRELKRKAEAATAIEDAAKAFTFAVLVNYYLEYSERTNRATTLEQKRSLLAKAIDKFGDKPASEVTKLDVINLITRKGRAKPGSSAGGLVYLNSILAEVRSCFKWAVRNAEIEIEHNPTDGVLKPLAREPTRDRVLSDDEIIAFWAACDEDGPVGYPFAPLFKLLLLTGQRRGEVGGMRWTELDLPNSTWNLPASRTKNGKAHTIHLSALAVEIIEALPVINGSDFIFTKEGDQAVTGFEYAKSRIPMPSEAGWRIHDLRRTCTTGMARLGVPPHIADKVLNHTAGTISGVAAVYNRFAYLDERREALDKWSAFIERLVRGGNDNVVPLVSARAG